MSAEAHARVAEYRLADSEAACRDLAKELAAAKAALAERNDQLEQLLPFAEAANAENRALDALFIAAQAGYAYDLRGISGL